MARSNRRARAEPALGGRSSSSFSYVSQNTYVPEGVLGMSDWQKPMRRRSAMRWVWFGFFGLGVALVMVLFTIKSKALDAKAYVVELERARAIELVSIRMLSAEIAHLESPARMKRLSDEFLNLPALRAAQILTMDQAMRNTPMRVAQKNDDGLKSAHDVDPFLTTNMAGQDASSLQVVSLQKGAR